MAFELFNGLLTNVFQASRPTQVKSTQVVFDFQLTIANAVTPAGTGAQIEWYPEFTWIDPNAATTLWYRELSEENQGLGDVRMSEVVRRFASFNNETLLTEGVHRVDAQFKRIHAFYRIQIRVAPGGADTCSAVVWDPFGTPLISAP